MYHAQPTPECMACHSEANYTSVIGLKLAEADFTSIFVKKTSNISPIWQLYEATDFSHKQSANEKVGGRV